jgi:hypothetical protein
MNEIDQQIIRDILANLHIPSQEPNGYPGPRFRLLPNYYLGQNIYLNIPKNHGFKLQILLEGQNRILERNNLINSIMNNGGVCTPNGSTNQTPYSAIQLTEAPINIANNIMIIHNQINNWNIFLTALVGQNI